MTLTSSYRRRTAGFTALFAALLLVLTALFAISPANADSHAGEGEDKPCDQYDYEKFNSASGSETLEWGSMTWGQAGSENVLSYDIDPGYSVEFCIKAGNVDNTFSGPRTGEGTVEHNNPDISHVGYRVVETPTTDASASIEQECPAEGDGPADSTVSLDNSGSNLATTFRIDADDAEPVFVEVPAGGTDTVELSGDYVLVRWFDVDEDVRKSVDAEFDGDCTPEQTVAPAAEITINCDIAEIYLDNTGSDIAVTYTITGADGYDTVEVPAGDDETLPLTIAEDTDYDITVTVDDEPLASDSGTYNCEGVDESVVDPAASVSVTCEAATIKLDNTASTQDKDVTYTITGVDGYDTVVVEAGTDQTIDIASTLSEDVAYDITVSAEGMDDVNAAGTYDCVEPTTTETPTPTETPTTDVSPDEVERPAPDPEPTQPAAQAAAQDELPATGLGSTELLLLALLMLGLGAAALLGSDPRRQN